jgi:hypothetical protein
MYISHNFFKYRQHNCMIIYSNYRSEMFALHVLEIRHLQVLRYIKRLDIHQNV